MSFVDTDDVIELNERLLAHVLAVCGVEVELPMRRLAVRRGDRPLRHRTSPTCASASSSRNLTEVFRGSEFNAFRAGDRGRLRWCAG